LDLSLHHKARGHYNDRSGAIFNNNIPHIRNNSTTPLGMTLNTHGSSPPLAPAAAVEIADSPSAVTDIRNRNFDVVVVLVLGDTYTIKLP
jgi:hypothetical protein